MLEKTGPRRGSVFAFWPRPSPLSRPGFDLLRASKGTLDPEAALSYAYDMDDAIRNEMVRRIDNVREKRDRLLRQVDDVNRELERLEISLSTYDSIKADVEGEPSGNVKGAIPPATKAKKKPEGTPTIAEMINMVLVDAKAKGTDALESQEIVHRIRAKWWPDAQSNDIAPLMWRLAKNEKLKKIGTKYSLISEIEEAIGILFRK